MVMVTTAMFFVPFCKGGGSGGRPWTLDESRTLMVGLTVWGALGSVLDSVLGGLLQRSVRDSRTGRIVEGEGGNKVLIGSPKQSQKTKRAGKAAVVAGEKDVPVVRTPSRVVESGWDILDNNDVNFLMALIMSLSSMVVAGWYWGYTLDSISVSS